MHIDFNSYFATVEQQANPRLRGKPVAITGGDRLSRTVISTASVEAKKRGVKPPITIPEALKICPELILVRGDSDKYLECTKRFLNILKSYTDNMEVFSIDEVFLEMRIKSFEGNREELIRIAEEIKERIKKEVGDWITCSVGISYNKIMAKFAGSLYKPDGLVILEDEEQSRILLDCVDLDEICGLGPRIKKRLNDMGIFGFQKLRTLSRDALRSSFKSYGLLLYDWARGIDHTPVVPFFEKEEVKSVGHRHTINRDISDETEIKQQFLKLCELVGRRLREKKLVGKTISIGYRAAFNREYLETTGHTFYGEGMQSTVPYTQDGFEIFRASWRSFHKIWQKEPIRMVGISVSGLKPADPENLTFLEDVNRAKIILQAIDKVNDKYGEFTLQRGILLNSSKMRRMPNPFLSDRRFKI